MKPPAVWINKCLIFPILLSTVILNAQNSLKVPVPLLRSQGELDEETGAGVICGQKDGQLYILTAAHVIGDPATLTIEFFTGSKQKGEVVRSNQGLDVAVVRCSVPEGYLPPASFSWVKSAEKNLQAVIVVGHPLGNYWDLNYNSNVKATDYDLDERLFTLAPIGISPGSSGGPVLNQQNELLGIVTRVDPVNVVCVDAGVLLKACQTWDVPLNLMTGIALESAAAAGKDDFRYNLFIQEGNSAFAVQKWAQAKTAFEQAQALSATPGLPEKIEQCTKEIARDASYKQLLESGKKAGDLQTALGFFQQAQQQRDNEEVRGIIQQTKEALARLNQLNAQSAVPASQLPAKVTDTESGNFLLVRGGTFMMGCNDCSPENYPAHPVYLDDYYMAESELTVEQYVRYLNEVHKAAKKKELLNISVVQKGIDFYYTPVAGKAKLPANMYLQDAVDYCNWLSNKTGYRFRLPTEAEWEYAAGGGHKVPADKSRPKTIPNPHPLGFVNMANKQEGVFCSDWYDPGYYALCSKQGTVLNPKGPPAVTGLLNVRGSTDQLLVRNNHSRIALESVLFDYHGKSPGLRLVRSLYPQAYDYGAIVREAFEKNMVFVEGGAFIMGNKEESNNQPHTVVLSDFYMLNTEVTERQWNLVMKGESFKDKIWEDDFVKVVKSDSEYESFVGKLNEVTGLNYGLPTEAQWEYAAYGGVLTKERTRFINGDSEHNGCQGGFSGPFKPCQCKPNVLGIYGLGNELAERCFDYYLENIASPNSVQDPCGPANGSYRVIRGQIWKPIAHRGILKLFGYRSMEEEYLGVRLVRSKTPVKRPEFKDPFEKHMVKITGGVVVDSRFTDEPSEKVADFYLSKYEVTCAEFEAVAGIRTNQDTCSRCPVSDVSVTDINSFLAVLNRNVAKEGKKYRLPTEAEWACAYAQAYFKANPKKNMTAYSLVRNRDNIDPDLFKLANLKHPDKEAGRTLPVGSLKADVLGLFDLIGNVDELCTYFDSQKNVSYGSNGGSYRTTPDRISIYNHSPFFYSDSSGGPDPKAPFVGFRLVMERTK